MGSLSCRGFVRQRIKDSRLLDWRFGFGAGIWVFCPGLLKVRVLLILLRFRV